jgi:predicted enzyme related to lactoylglutathione lyase
MADTYVHFQLPADDPETMMEFYSSAFGWAFNRTPMPGIPGGEYILIETADEKHPVFPAVCTNVSMLTTTRAALAAFHR